MKCETEIVKRGKKFNIIKINNKYTYFYMVVPVDFEIPDILTSKMEALDLLFEKELGVDDDE